MPTHDDACHRLIQFTHGNRAYATWNASSAAFAARSATQFANGGRSRWSGGRRRSSNAGSREVSSARHPRPLEPGVAAGLAWTPVGGDVLYVEAVLLPEANRVDSYRSIGRCHEGIGSDGPKSRAFPVGRTRSGKASTDCGVHVHVPAGATPKDGPSAGVTMATALASLYSHQPVRREPR